MEIQDLLNESDAFLDKEIVLKGRIYIYADARSYIAFDAASFKAGKRVYIDDGDRIGKILKKKLSPRGGGVSMFVEDCIISGTLHQKDDMIVITNIQSCSVSAGYEDSVIDVPPEK